MKVGKRSDGKIEVGGGGARQHASGQAASVRPSFGAAMGNALEELEVRALLERLDAVAEKLSTFPAEGLLIEYKFILKELLARAMRGFSLRRDLKWRHTDRNTYVTIEKAEAALSELEQVFSQEGGRVQALRLMEEIKGCLISLLF
ncbi:MAG: DUF327 family protein [Synergistaceae bacterium]|nr:DUF327 family protein [Synergistaceae bacterium]